MRTLLLAFLLCVGALIFFVDRTPEKEPERITPEQEKKYTTKDPPRQIQEVNIQVVTPRSTTLRDSIPVPVSSDTIVYFPIVRSGGNPYPVKFGLYINYKSLDAKDATLDIGEAYADNKTIHYSSFSREWLPWTLADSTITFEKSWFIGKSIGLKFSKGSATSGKIFTTFIYEKE